MNIQLFQHQFLASPRNWIKEEWTFPKPSLSTNGPASMNKFLPQISVPKNEIKYRLEISRSKSDMHKIAAVFTQRVKFLQLLQKKPRALFIKAKIYGLKKRSWEISSFKIVNFFLVGNSFSNEVRLRPRKWKMTS